MKKLYLATLASLILSTGSAFAMTPITEQDVKQAQEKWAQGIVGIGEVYQNKGDYKAEASKLIRELYAYDKSKVLFKPTLANEDKFRQNFDEALSYFVGGDIAEDKGFAIKPWSNVRFAEQEIITDSDSATAMGIYYFTPAGETNEVKVEYTFGYMRDADNNLLINVHHSSLPYTPSE